MGYFDKNNQDFFKILISTKANLYLDIIDKLIEETQSLHNEINLEDAKEIALDCMKLYPNLGEQVTAKDLLNDLEECGWIKLRKREMNRFYYIMPNAITQHQALQKMDKERDGSQFEFKNAFTQIYHICEDYKKDRNISTGNIYVLYLKEIINITNQIDMELLKCASDFEEQINKLKDEKPLKELVKIIQNIICGNQMKNYYRLLNDEDKFIKYKDYIIDTIDYIKIYDIEKFIIAYQKETGCDENESTNYIEKNIDKLETFFSSRYDMLKSNIAQVERKCQRKALNRLNAYNYGMTENKDISTIFLEKIANEIHKTGDEDHINSEEIQKHIGIYGISLFEGENSLQNPLEQKETTTKLVEETAVYEVDQEAILREQNERIKHDKKHTTAYIKEKFGNKKKIRSSEFNGIVDEDRIYDIIKHSTDIDFPYRLILIDGCPDKTGKIDILTPFIIERKENK